MLFNRQPVIQFTFQVLRHLLSGHDRSFNGSLLPTESEQSLKPGRSDLKKITPNFGLALAEDTLKYKGLRYSI